MSSFFDSLNFNHGAAIAATAGAATADTASSSSSAIASGSGTTTNVAPARIAPAPTPRKRRSIARPTASSSTSTPPSQMEVYWDCPPSSLMGEWGKSLVELAQAKRRKRGEGSLDDDDTEAQRTTWTRQDSHASSTSTTSTTSTSSHQRRIKRRPGASTATITTAPSSTFKRHASSFAALGGDVVSRHDELHDQLDSNANTGVQKLLADLSIRVQEIDRLVEQEEGNEDDADETITGSGFATASGHTSQNTRSAQTPQRSQWDRCITFPPTGSPRVSKETEGQGDDSFDDVDFDEEFLRDMELDFLRDIELSQQQRQREGSAIALEPNDTAQAPTTAAAQQAQGECSISKGSSDPHNGNVNAVPSCPSESPDTVDAARIQPPSDSSSSPPPRATVCAGGKPTPQIDDTTRTDTQGKPTRTIDTTRTDTTGKPTRIIDTTRTDTQGKPTPIIDTTRTDTKGKSTLPTDHNPSTATRSHSPVKTTIAHAPTTTSQLVTRSHSTKLSSPTTNTRTRSAGLPRQATQQHTHAPNPSRHPLATMTTRNSRRAVTTTSAAFKPPSRVGPPPPPTMTQPQPRTDTDFDAMLDDEDDTELERALAAAGY